MLIRVRSKVSSHLCTGLSPHRFVKCQNHRQSEERTHFGSINRGIIVGTEEVLYQYIHQLAGERIRARGFEVQVAYDRLYVLLAPQPEKLRKFPPRVRQKLVLLLLSESHERFARNGHVVDHYVQH